MTISTCPIATVHASVEQVWSLLSEPARYAVWWDAQTRSVVPEGSATPGQRIYAQTRALGRNWAVNIAVEAVDHAQHQLHLKTSLPLGITVHNHITCTLLSDTSCRIAFG